MVHGIDDQRTIRLRVPCTLDGRSDNAGGTGRLLSFVVRRVTGLARRDGRRVRGAAFTAGTSDVPESEEAERE